MTREIAENTRRAYAADWAAFARWCRLTGANALPPTPDIVAAYLSSLGTGTAQRPPLSPTSVERRLAGLLWSCDQRGTPLDRTHPAIRAALAGVRQRASTPDRKAPLTAQDIRAMNALLPYDLRGLRDRAMLLLGFAAGLGRSELVGLDLGQPASGDGGWLDLCRDGARLTLPAAQGWSRIDVGRGSADRTCPVHAVSQWVSFAGIARGPLFLRITRDGTGILDERLSDRHVARLVKRLAEDAGLRPDLDPAERRTVFSGQSLRTGLAASLGLDDITALRRRISSPEDEDPMTGVSLNLTRAVGL